MIFVSWLCGEHDVFLVIARWNRKSGHALQIAGLHGRQQVSLCSMIEAQLPMGHRKGRLDFISSLPVCRHVGICWNMLEYDGICWNMLEYVGICWNMLDMPQTGAHGSSQNIARCVAIVLISRCLRTAWQYRLRWRCTPLATGSFVFAVCIYVKQLS